MKFLDINFYLERKGIRERENGEGGGGGAIIRGNTVSMLREIDPQKKQHFMFRKPMEK